MKLSKYLKQLEEYENDSYSIDEDMMALAIEQEAQIEKMKNCSNCSMIGKLCPKCT